MLEGNRGKGQKVKGEKGSLWLPRAHFPLLTSHCSLPTAHGHFAAHQETERFDVGYSSQDAQDASVVDLCAWLHGCGADESCDDGQISAGDGACETVGTRARVC